jgi:hypothetical protein
LLSRSERAALAMGLGVTGGHPDCGGGSAAIIAALPNDFPIGPRR